jgi:hypothetical protein
LPKFAVVGVLLSAGISAGIALLADRVTVTQLQPQQVQLDTRGDPLVIWIGAYWTKDGVCEGQFTVTGTETATQVRVDNVISREHSNSTCAGFGLANATAWTELTLAAPLGDREVVRASDGARLPVFPVKPASEDIGSVDSVDVTVDRRGAVPTVMRTLSGDPARWLAAAVDALRPEPDYDPSPCPMGRVYPGTDTLVFHKAGRTVTAVVTVGGCGGVDVEVDGVAQPRLGGDVDAPVLAELGLPPTYRA